MQEHPMRSLLRATALISLTLAFSIASPAQDTSRQDEVAKRGADVMPFSHLATLLVFAKTDDGGTLRLIVRDPTDTKQVQMVRVHLQDMRGRFEKGDYSGPSHIHGDSMPGLAELKAAKPGQITVSYQDVADGAELEYRTSDPKLISALHAWINAQLSDHGKDATAAHWRQECAALAALAALSSSHAALLQELA
jgi:hypothetical protein